MSLILTPGQFSQRAGLYHQLSQLLSAGISIVRALEQIRNSPPARSFRKPLQNVLDEIQNGRTFSESMQHGGWLPVFDLALIEAGERSGRLVASLRILADYYDDRARITKQVISNLVYPVGLIHFAALVFLIVLPFAGSQFNASLPVLFFKAALILSPVYLVTAFLIFAMQSKHGERWRAMVESVLRFIPILGAARRDLALSRLSIALEALINAGVGIFEAWELAATASGSPALRRAVGGWRPRLEAGQTPSEAVNACREFPEMFANFYASGEVSGQLDDTLKRLHAYYNDEGSRKLHNFAQWTPRLIYAIVAGVIAYKVVQFYTAYFNQIGAISGGF